MQVVLAEAGVQEDELFRIVYSDRPLHVDIDFIKRIDDGNFSALLIALLLVHRDVLKRPDLVVRLGLIIEYLEPLDLLRLILDQRVYRESSVDSVH